MSDTLKAVTNLLKRNIADVVSAPPPAKFVITKLQSNR